MLPNTSTLVFVPRQFAITGDVDTNVAFIRGRSRRIVSLVPMGSRGFLRCCSNFDLILSTSSSAIRSNSARSSSLSVTTGSAFPSLLAAKISCWSVRAAEAGSLPHSTITVESSGAVTVILLGIGNAHAGRFPLVGRHGIQWSGIKGPPVA